MFYDVSYILFYTILSYGTDSFRCLFLSWYYIVNYTVIYNIMYEQNASYYKFQREFRPTVGIHVYNNIITFANHVVLLSFERARRHINHSDGSWKKKKKKTESREYYNFI